MTSNTKLIVSFIKLILVTLSFSSGLELQASEEFDEAMTSKFTTAFWNSFNADIAAGDLDKYLSHWDENAERITPTVHARGIDEIRATYRGYLENFTDFKQTEVRRLVEGNVSISELITVATSKKQGKHSLCPM